MIKTSLPYPFIEISLDALLYNVDNIRTKISNTQGIMAIVKDLAYGCGAVTISRTLEQAGINYLAVATTKEARSLKDAGIAIPILVLGEFESDDLAWGYLNNITFSINKVSDVNIICVHKQPVRIHLHIDTGMGRLGISPSDIPSIANKLLENTNITCEGIYTHLASADVPKTTTVEKQTTLFTHALSLLHNAGITPIHIHYANSAGLLRFPLLPQCTLVRPGIALYGSKPDPSQEFDIKLKSIVSLKGCIVKLEHTKANTPISYMGRYITKSDTNIATINLGYGIGLPRSLTNTGSVLIRNNRYTIAGTVTMDYIMVDVGLHSALEIGDEVIAMGSCDNDSITPDDVAKNAGTIAYEVLCGLSLKLDRHYFLNGKISHTVPGMYC